MCTEPCPLLLVLFRNMGTNFQFLAIILFTVCHSYRAAPLSEFRTGIATNYGGAQDGMSPYSPSYGTKDVRLNSGTQFLKNAFQLTVPFSCCALATIVLCAKGFVAQLQIELDPQIHSKDKCLLLLLHYQNAACPFSERS